MVQFLSIIFFLDFFNFCLVFQKFSFFLCHPVLVRHAGVQVQNKIKPHFSLNNLECKLATCKTVGFLMPCRRLLATSEGRCSKPSLIIVAFGGQSERVTAVSESSSAFHTYTTSHHCGFR